MGISKEQFMKSRNKWIAGLAAMTMFATGTASADSGFFVGGSIGSSSIDEPFDGVVLDTDATAYRFVGGIQVSDTLGLEVGYQDFGNLDETIIIGPISSLALLAAEGWTLGGTLGLPLTDQLSLFGRAGMFFWDADVIVDGFAIDTPGDENPYYGAGLRLNVSPNLSLIGDWSRFELDEVDTNVVSIGLQYLFGG